MRFLLRRTGWIVLLCACPAFTAAEIPHPACAPSGEVKALLETHFEGGGDEMEPRILAALETHPHDVHLHRAYQNGHRDGAEVLERYRTEAAAHPDDAMWLYLYGRVQDNHEDPAAEATLRKALEVDPSYPWAHLALAHFYETVRRDPERLRVHAAAAIDQCPNSEYILQRLGDLPREDVERRAAALRSRLAEDRDPSSLILLRAIWSAEFKVIPPAEHDAVRERIRGDLASLSGPGLAEDQRALDALLRGYRIVGDDAGLDRTIAETARLFPDDENARRAANERFRERHPAPDDECDVSAGRVYREAFSDATRRWVALWPDDPDVRVERLEALSWVPDAPAEELASAVDAVRQTAAKHTSDVPGTPIVFEAAQALVLAGRGLDQVPALIDAGLAEIRSRAAKGEAGQNDPEREAGGLAMRIQARLRLGDVDAARAEFAELPRTVPIDTGSRVLTPEEETGWRKYAAIEFVLRYLPVCGSRDTSEAVRITEILAPDVVDIVKMNWPPFPPARRWRDKFERKSLALADFELQDLGGRTWHLSDLLGKVTLIYVWMHENELTSAMLPWVEDLGARLRGRTDVVVLTFSVDSRLEKLAPMLRDSGFTFPVVPARDYVRRLLDNSLSLPLTWIVDRNGTIVREFGGYNGDKDGWFAETFESIEEVGAGTEANAPHPACVPSEEVRGLLEQYHDEPWKGGDVAVEAAAGAPVTLGVFPPTLTVSADELESFRADAVAHPDDAARLYLVGRALQIQGDAGAQAKLLAALAADPRHPWTHLALAELYEKKDADVAKVRTHLLAAIDACPSSSYILERIGDLPPEDVDRRAAAVRAQLAVTHDPALVPMLRAIWAAEFHVYPPSEHDAVRERIRGDLVTLQAEGLVDDRGALDASLEGYQLVGDTPRDWSVGEIVRRTPTGFIDPPEIPGSPPRPRLDGFKPTSIELPAFELQDLSGKTWRTSDLQGKVTLIHLWSSEMNVTRAMAPWMKDLEERMRGRGDFVLLTFALDRNVGMLWPMARDNGITFPVVPARDYVTRLMDGAPRLPSTWIVDRSGKVVRESFGYGDDKDAWIEAALRAIDEVSR